MLKDKPQGAGQGPGCSAPGHSMLPLRGHLRPTIVALTQHFPPTPLLLSGPQDFATFHCLQSPAPVGWGSVMDWLVRGKESASCRPPLPNLRALVGGQIIGDGQLVIRGAATLRDAEPGQITLVDQSEKNQRLENCRARGRGRPRSFTPRRPSRHPGRRRSPGVCHHRASFLPAARRCSRIGISPLAVVSPTAADRPERRRSSVRHHRRPRDHRRRLDDPLGRPHHGRLADRPGRDHLSQRRAVRKHGGRAAVPDPRQRRAGGLWLRLRFRRRPARAVGPIGQRRVGGRRGSRRRLDDRPRHLRPDVDRRGHQDRRPGDGRPQLPHRPPQHALLAGRHRRQHDHRRLRGDGRPGGRSRPRAHRQTGPCWGRWPA